LGVAGMVARSPASDGRQFRGASRHSVGACATVSASFE
jgi:hypothetical protein